MPRDRERGPGGRSKTPVESLVTGLAIALGFVGFWAFGGHQTWALFAALFGGVLPASRGFTRIIEARAERRRLEAPARKPSPQDEAHIEKTVLRVARDHGGRVTPSLVALESEFSVERAERVLEDLTRNGHASMRVREDGRIEYEFIEFIAGPTEAE
jgi:hypothetical protein